MRPSAGKKRKRGLPANYKGATAAQVARAIKQCLRRKPECRPEEPEAWGCEYRDYRPESQPMDPPPPKP